MRSVVTGAAGFIGSHLAEHLVALGHEVVGIDCFTPYYDAAIKRANLAMLLDDPHFHLVAADLATVELRPLLRGADYVFHLAAQPGVRASWGDHFAEYTARNILATQRLLEAIKDLPVRKLVFASSSSVYGNAPLPMCEAAPPRPISPYGVSKLAAEHLCLLYEASHGLPVVALRYFTVYGPRQRPDMAIHRFIRAIARGERISLYGDGDRSRDFTYVDDVVRATTQAALSPASGMALNIGGGSRIALRDLISALAASIGCPARVAHLDDQRGDVAHTTADCAQARRVLGFAPSVGIAEGLRRQVAWQLARA